MSKRLCLFTVSLLMCVLLFSSTAVAATYEYYTVSGSTLEEVWADIEANGPTDDEGNHWAGKADVSVTADGQMGVPKFDPILPEPWWKATITGTVTWNIAVTITLPTWGGYDQASPEAQAEWDRFLDALKNHEDQHEQVVNDAFNNLQPPAQTSFSGSGTGPSQGEAAANAQQDLQSKLDQELDRVQQALQEASDKYDDETDHGATQGATLNTSIGSETPQGGASGPEEQPSITTGGNEDPTVTPAAAEQPNKSFFEKIADLFRRIFNF